jgi:hypothetical protein
MSVRREISVANGGRKKIEGRKDGGQITRSNSAACSATAYASILLAGGILLGCGTSEDDNTAQSDDTTGGTVIVVGATPGQRKLTSIPITFANSDRSKARLGLTPEVEGFTVQLAGCRSGYSAAVTQADADGLEVYAFDRGCLAKLTQLTVAGTDYFPTAPDPFTTWQTGDIAVFDEAGEPGTAPLTVIVDSTLGDPVTGADAIRYQYADIVRTSDRSIMRSTIGTSGKYKAGVNVEPSFTVRSIELVGLSAVEGGRFKFVLECTTDIGATIECETVSFTDIDYKIVKDTFGSSPSAADCDAAFATAGASITLPKDRVAPMSQGTTRGGFVTATLDGPADFALNPNALLIIRSYGASYQYFNVDVAVRTTF